MKLLASTIENTCTTYHSAAHDSWISPIYCIVTSASTSSVFETALQRLQAIQDSGRHTSLEKSYAAVDSALESVYKLDAQGLNRFAAKELMQFLEGNLRVNALVLANRVLAEANAQRLSSRSLIGLIRSTARVRRHLPAWKKAYRESWEQVVKLGKDPEALFIGLPKGTEQDIATDPK